MNVYPEPGDEDLTEDESEDDEEGGVTLNTVGVVRLDIGGTTPQVVTPKAKSIMNSFELVEMDKSG